MDMSLVCEETPNNVKLGMLKLTSGIHEEIIEGQKIDLGLIDRLELINQRKGGDFRIEENGVMRFRDMSCVPNVQELKKFIMEVGHISGLSIHLDATKMYENLKKIFQWPELKKEVVEFVYACLTCQKSKIEHHKLLVLMQPLSIPEWKRDNISMNFVMIFPKTMKGCDSIWVIVDRLAKSTHFIPIKIIYTL